MQGDTKDRKEEEEKRQQKRILLSSSLLSLVGLFVKWEAQKYRFPSTWSFHVGSVRNGTQPTLGYKRPLVV